MRIIEPQSDKEWEEYYLCRWETLRKPWGQPRGSEVIDDDDLSFHAMAVDDQKVCGTIRLSESSEGIFQIRSMGVREEYRKKGIGKKLMHYMENLAKSKQASCIFLHARENALDFYQKEGYRIIEPSYLLFGEIQHFKMEKELD